MQLRIKPATAAMIWLLLMTLVPASGQDVVIVRRDGSDQTSTRKGVIADWRGRTLTMQTDAGNKEIDNDQIVDFETKWSDDYIRADQQFQSGDFAGAAAGFASAAAVESRPWAKVFIAARQTESALAIGDFAGAARHFADVIDYDPQTRFLHLAPIQWAESERSIRRLPVADDWIESSDPTLQLIAASWLLRGDQRDAALKKLEQLASDFNPQIAGLARAQLWRVRGLTAKEKQIAVWADQVRELPAAIQAGPWVVIAEAQARVGMINAAAANLMRVPILYPQNRPLVSVALSRTARMLHNAGRDAEAAIVEREQ